jgi:hypothetical protein
LEINTLAYFEEKKSFIKLTPGGVNWYDRHGGREAGLSTGKSSGSFIA